MEQKQKIIAATLKLITESGKDPAKITVRDICAESGASLGHIQYYFGGKDGLIETCVQQIIGGIVENFRDISAKLTIEDPYERLEYLSFLNLNYLFDNAAISKISILSDMVSPQSEDNTNLTTRAYLPLIAACRREWGEEEVLRRAFCLISCMQQMFLRCETIRTAYGVDLMDIRQRKKFHAEILAQLMEGEGVS